LPAGNEREGRYTLMSLTPEVRAFLEEKVRWAVLGTINADGSIQQSVMWFALVDDNILMNTKAGRVKDRNIRADSRVSVCVEEEEQYVTISGRATMIDDRERSQADAHRLAIRYEGEERAAEMMETDYRHQERVSILISIDSVTTHNL
jgi:PPOX class probable F420-dependent enzyme